MGNDVTDAAWWSDAVGYEVYIRSFADSDGDGIGDLPGLTARLDYLADLGVDIVWVTPFYPSPHGRLRLRRGRLHRRRPALRHAGRLRPPRRRGARARACACSSTSCRTTPRTSTRGSGRPRSARDSPHRDYYLWRDPGPDGGPPNNWRSHFGGPAWTFDEASGQWYLPPVPARAARPELGQPGGAARRSAASCGFWLDRGVDGFRIDVAHALVKHPSLRRQPGPRRGRSGRDPARGVPRPAPRPRPRPARHPRHLPRLARHRPPARRRAARRGVPGLGRRGERLRRRRAARPVLLLPGAAHDVGRRRPPPGRRRDAHPRPRPVRLGALEPRRSSRPRPASAVASSGRRRALSFLVVHGVPARPALPVPGRRARPGRRRGPARARPPTPVAVRNEHGGGEGRDPVRTPMPWTPDEPSFGFSTGTPWLPVPANHAAADTVAAQRADPGSTLHAVRRLLQARRARAAEPGSGGAGAPTCPETVLAYRRGTQLVVLNAGPAPATVSWSGSGTLSSRPARSSSARGLVVGPDAVAVVDEEP